MATLSIKARENLHRAGLKIRHSIPNGGKHRLPPLKDEKLSDMEVNGDAMQLPAPKVSNANNMCSQSGSARKDDCRRCSRFQLPGRRASCDKGSDSDVDMTRLCEELSMAKRRGDDQRKRNKELTKRLKDLRDNIAQLETEVKSLEQDKKILQNDCQGLRNNIDEKENEISLLLRNHDEKMKDDCVWLEKIKLLEQHVTSLQQQKSDVEDRHKREMEIVQSQADEKYADLSRERDDQIRAFEDKLERLKRHTAEALKLNSHERQQQLDELTKELCRLTEIEETLRSKLKKQRQTQSCSGCHKLDAYNKKIREELLSRNDSIASLRKTCERLEKQLQIQSTVKLRR